MKTPVMFIFFLALAVLSACTQPEASPTPQPLLPSPTQPCVNDPYCQPTHTAAPTPTPAPLLEVLLEGCDWGIDIRHSMGEVTNAYLLARNRGPGTVTTLCLTLVASDEGREHPDKTRCFPELPAGKQIALKLTVDTTYGTYTDYYVVADSDQADLQLPTQRCQPLKDGVRPAYDRVLDVIQDIVE